MSKITVICLFLQLFVCSAGNKLMADWNPPLVLNSQSSGTGKKTVLVYYANETSLHQKALKNHQTIVNWLAASQSESLKFLAKSIEEDRTEFARVVDQEIQSLIALGNESDLELAVFTNGMAVKGHFSIHKQGTEKLAQVPLSLPSRSDFVYRSHPLAHPNALKLALESVAGEFPPQKYDYVLITKSHGSANRSLIPRLGIDASQTSRERLLSRLERKQEDNDRTSAGKGTSQNSNLGTVATSNLGTANSSNLGTSTSSNLGSKGKWLAGEKGTTKDRFVETLVQLNRDHDIRFRLVCMESCQSSLTTGQTRLLKDCVHSICTSDKDGLKYSTIDYSVVGEALGKGESLSQALIQQIKK